MSVPPGVRPRLTVVVPVLHDTMAVTALLREDRDPDDQWIVVNGDAADRSLEPVRQAHADVRWLDAPPGRGQQLAAGVACATGDWVVMLHADTRLPDGWRDEVTRAASDASNDWGCFGLRLDTPAWQARVIEAAVGLRVWLFRLPYGDQALFFRRATLEAVGGVPVVPLMEDVVLARRFGRLGPPFRSRLAGLTSARRWERDGWGRRCARNMWVLTKYLLGVPPERLATAYDGTNRC